MDGLSSYLYIDPAEESTLAPVPRETVRRALAVYMSPATRIGLTHFILDYLLYTAMIAGVLFLEPLWLKITCAVLAGVKIANLGTLAHDAAHGNLVRSPKLNKLLGVLAFMPGLFNYRLWIYDHHHIHHPFANGRHRDSWVPFSKAEFDRLTRPRQWLERIYRSSTGLGFAPYMIVERWLKVKLIPGKFLPARFQASARRHFAALMVYLAAFLGFLAAAPLYSHTGSATAILLGFVLPFYVWMFLLSFTVYVQHTHARIPWFDGPVDRKTAIPQEVISLHLVFPKIINDLTHNIYDHGVHHVNPRIPFHQLPKAQQRLNELTGTAAVIQRFSLGWVRETLKNCKLYDFQNNQWLDFDGRPTGPIAISPAQRVAIEFSSGSQYQPLRDPRTRRIAGAPVQISSGRHCAPRPL